MVETKQRKKATSIDFATKADLATLKSEVDKLDMDEFETIPTDLSKLSNVVDDVVKDTVYEDLI